MTSEIFRFAVVRSPQSATAEKLEKEAIRLIKSPQDFFPSYVRYKDLIEEGKTRTFLEADALSTMQSKSFISVIQNPGIPIYDLDEWLHQQLKEVSLQQVAEKAEQLFQRPAGEFENNDSFQSIRGIFYDSMIVASVSPEDEKHLRPLIMKGVRIFHLLKNLDALSAIPAGLTTKKFLQLPILLPTDIFPLPVDNSFGPDQSDDRANRVEEARVEMEAAQAELQSNHVVMEELSQAYDQQILLKRRAIPIIPLDGEEVQQNTDATAFPSILSPDIVAKMSQEVQTVLGKLNVPIDFVDVPNVVLALERKNEALAKKLYKNAGGRYTLIGNSVVVLSEGMNLNYGHTYPTPGRYQLGDSADPITYDYSLPNSQGKVNNIHVAELLKVRQDIKRYEPGEVAHIENIMQGEYKDREHRRLDRTEETIEQTVERTEENERDLQTTEQYELQTESSKTISNDTSKEAGLTVSVSYGPFSSTASGKYSSDTSTESSKKSAMNYARSVVDRSVQRIKESVVSRRKKTTLTEVEVINKHGFDNKEGSGHVAGIYRWVDKIYELQVVNYGLRTMLEFIIPEPAAFYRYALTSYPQIDSVIEKPEPPGDYLPGGGFNPLKPGDLDETNFAMYAGQSGATDVEPPPAKYKRVGYSFEKQYQKLETFESNQEVTDHHSIIQFSEELALPEDYLAKDAYLRINGLYLGAWKVDIIIGDNRNINRQNETRLYASLNGEVGSVPFAVYARNAQTLGMSVEIRCERSQALYKQWQMDTFNAIMSAYNEQKARYEEQLELQNIQEGVVIEGRNPLINREIEKIELKKLSLSQLTGQHYDVFDAMHRNVPAAGYPQMNLEDAYREGKYIHFFEQALEWEHLTYLFYSYFWGMKKEWPTNIQLQDNDPLFERFLQAGSARVQVPIRPGFEEVVLSFIQQGGNPWEGDQAPHIDNGDSDFYLSILEEIKAQNGVDFETREGKINVTQGSRTVTGTNTAFKAATNAEDSFASDVDREIIVKGESYRIASVESPTSLTLATPYKGATDTSIGYAIGVKYVGEPWLEEVPTNLVYLQADDELPAYD